MEDPGRLQFIGSQRVRHDWAISLFTFFHLVFRTLSRAIAIWVISHRFHSDYSFFPLSLNLVPSCQAKVLFLQTKSSEPAFSELSSRHKHFWHCFLWYRSLNFWTSFTSWLLAIFTLKCSRFFYAPERNLVWLHRYLS